MRTRLEPGDSSRNTETVGIHLLERFADRRTQASVSNLTPDSVVYFVMMAEDGAGERFALRRRWTRSPRHRAFQSTPGMKATWVTALSAESSQAPKGWRAGPRNWRCASCAANEPKRFRSPRTDTSLLAFDRRQLQRWKLNEDRLPAGAEVLFREATFWQRYRSRIIGVIVLFTLQSALIAALLVERRRRRKANIGLKESEERYRNVVEAQTRIDLSFSS